MIRLIFCGANGHDYHKEVEEKDVTNAHLYALLERIYHKMHEKSLETQLAPQLKGVMEDAVNVMRNPPAIWHPYIKSRDIHGLVHMELRELVNALGEHQSSQEIREELVHSVAAMLMYME